MPTGTGLVVENNHGAGAHAAAGFTNHVVVHGQIKMFRSEKICGATARQKTLQLIAILHTAGMLLQ